jgi:hypothetical protein
MHCTKQENGGTSHYYNVDFDLDGNVNDDDKIFYWIPNAGKGSQVPE